MNHRPHAESKEPKKLKPPVITVVGLLAKQMQTVEEGVRDLVRMSRLKLQFVSKNITKPDFPSGTDQVFLFTKFITHDWQGFDLFFSSLLLRFGSFRRLR